MIMADEDNKFSLGASNSEDALLTDLNLGGEAMGGAEFDQGRPLPKKVELDIDDMLLESEEEEPPPPPRPRRPHRKFPNRRRKKRRKRSSPGFPKKKLAILMGIAALVLTVIAAPIIYIFGEKEEKTVEEAIPKPPKLYLKPFIVNFPAKERDRLVKVSLAVEFPNNAVESEFNHDLPVLRDLIFRFIQGQGPAISRPKADMDELIKQITGLLNGLLKAGRVDKVEILEIKNV